MNTRELAVALFQDGMDTWLICEKLEIQRNTLNKYLRPVRGPIRGPNRNWTAPDGTPLAQWLERNNIKSIGLATVRSRLHLGWDFYDAVYTKKQIRSSNGKAKSLRDQALARRREAYDQAQGVPA